MEKEYKRSNDLRAFTFYILNVRNVYVYGGTVGWKLARSFVDTAHYTYTLTFTEINSEYTHTHTTVCLQIVPR
jgi:hypothetical protein